MKHNIILTKKSKSVKGTIHLTGSKSECNRALIIEALSNGKVKVENMSDAADTVTLLRILKSEVGMPSAEVLNKNENDIISQSTFRIPQLNKSEINIGPAGTAMRFLTAYLTLLEGAEVILTGSERMKQRPIGILVDALQQLGASIKYDEKDGFPPLRIKGGFEQLTSQIN